MRSSLLPVVVLAAATGLGCVSVGSDFPSAPIAELAVGRTNQAEVQKEFGAPWRTGLEDGQRTWTYGHYRYSLFGGERARDLVLKWNAQGVLASYTYATTEDE
jgi:hypothetical protein